MLTLVVTLSLLGASDVDQNRIDFFEKRIRPVLVERCYECHGGDADIIEGGLTLDSRASLLKGGDSGPAIVPGKPDESLLIRVIRFNEQGLEMPPDGKLPDRTLEAFVKWVAMGAPWPESKTADDAAEGTETGYDFERIRREHWSFAPVTRAELPVVGDAAWSRQPLDRFVLARLDEAGMTPAPEADRRTWIRRAYFGVIGLPPTPEEVELFVNDGSPLAYEAVVDRLLASPQYGERWSRHWLDVARYNDGFGVGWDGPNRPEAHRYRDWVVRCFNEDVPYDQFVRQQIAGDLMPGGTTAELAAEMVNGSADDVTADGAFGTGFLALGPLYGSDGGDPQSIADSKAETLEDRMDTTFRGFMGLTIACARCHDHKFDPIPTQDYYSIASVFNNSAVIERPLAPAPVVKRWDDHDKALKDLKQKIAELRRDVRKMKGEEAKKGQTRLDKMQEEFGKLGDTLPPKYPFVHAVADSGAEDMHVALRGNLRKPGELAPRRFLRVFAGESRQHWAEGSGRLDLAYAVASRDNPLTARVFVNRVWLHHFGQGIVRTPSNFGVLGEPPTHPKLLDWLAADFMANGWSIKRLHRKILLSATYRMSSQFREEYFQRDADNRLMWRRNPQRLEVEPWRDSLLAVTGELSQQLGGEPTKELMSSPRRTIYSVISRSGDQFDSDLFLRLFDFPAARITSEQRVISTVPQQYLFVLNSDFMVARAKALAERLASETSDDEQRVERAYWLLYQRPPTEAELQLGREFLSGEGEGLPKWQQYAQVLLGAHEFLYLQ